MLFWVFMVLFLPSAGLSAVFIIYIILLWYSALGNNAPPGKAEAGKGLTEADLEKIPRVTGKELVLGTECAVCLDEIEEEQPARMVPGCNHGFHVECADAWLSKNPVCPVCRGKLDPEFFAEQSPC